MQKVSLKLLRILVAAWVLCLNISAYSMTKTVELPDGNYTLDIDIQNENKYNLQITSPNNVFILSMLPKLQISSKKISMVAYALFQNEIENFIESFKKEKFSIFQSKTYKEEDSELYWNIFTDEKLFLAQKISEIWSLEDLTLAQDFLRDWNKNKNDPRLTRDTAPKTITAKKILIVTHTSRIFDAKMRTQAGLNSLVADFKNSQYPVMYLVADDHLYDYTWFSSDKKPDYLIASSNGDHDIEIKADEIYLAGGYFSLCLNRTFNKLLKANPLKIKITLPLASIYEDKYFWPIDHLKGQAQISALDWKSSMKYTPNLEEIEKALGMSSLIEGTKTLLEPWSNKYEIAFQKDGKLIYKMGRNKKKKLLLNFISTSKIQD